MANIATMINSCQAIALGFGYVESNATSWLIYSAERKVPQTRKEALHSLVEYLWDKFSIEKKDTEKFIDTYKSDMAKCCQKAWTHRDRQSPPTKCPTCQANYNVEKKETFSLSNWMQFLHDIAISDCDSYGEHDCIKNSYGWNPWMYQFDVPQNQMLIIGENAEHIITLALAELHPELKEICHDDEYGYDFPNLEDKGNYILEDYLRMMDESCVKMGHGYGKSQDELELVEDPDTSGVLNLQKKQKKFKQTIIFEFPNGSQSTMVDGRYIYVKYHTGDEIWLDYVDGAYVVSNAITHDGIDWNQKFGSK